MTIDEEQWFVVLTTDGPRKAGKPMHYRDGVMWVEDVVVPRVEFPWLRSRCKMQGQAVEREAAGEGDLGSMEEAEGRNGRGITSVIYFKGKSCNQWEERRSTFPCCLTFLVPGLYLSTWSGMKTAS